MYGLTYYLGIYYLGIYHQLLCTRFVRIRLQDISKSVNESIKEYKKLLDRPHVFMLRISFILENIYKPYLQNKLKDELYISITELGLGLRFIRLLYI